MIGTGKQIDVNEDFPAAFDITVTDAIVNGEEVGNLVILAKPVGVFASFRWFEATPEFTFDTAGSGFDLGKLAGAVSA